jgi:hypothetical protein
LPIAHRDEVAGMPFITQILLPMRDNFGRVFGRDAYRPFHRRMIQRFGGWTRKGQAEGAWLAPSGEFYAEEHWVYEIGHTRRNLRFWEAEKERLRIEFDQQDIWIVQYDVRQI